MDSAHLDKRIYLPGKIILLTLWVFFTGFSLYLTPTADFFGASVAGFLPAALCALPVAFVAGVLFQLATNGVNLLRQTKKRHQYRRMNKGWQPPFP